MLHFIEQYPLLSLMMIIFASIGLIHSMNVYLFHYEKIFPKKAVTEQYKVSLHLFDLESNENYSRGYKRAKEVINNGSDADSLYLQSLSDNSDYARGWRYSCKEYIDQKDILATHRASK